MGPASRGPPPKKNGRDDRVCGCRGDLSGLLPGTLTPDQMIGDPTRGDAARSAQRSNPGLETMVSERR